jgi:protein gp37
MADKTHIQWTEATWNPITGCSIVSLGCTNCYAMKLAGTRLMHHPSRAGLTKEVNGNHVWTGEVRFNEQWLTQPLSWKKPRMIFVCAHADLFHEAVPDAWIDQIFAVMALTPHHTYQILTKRPERMKSYLSASGIASRIAEATIGPAPNPRSLPTPPVIFNVPVGPPTKYGAPEFGYRRMMNPRSWPLPNVWLGVSVEDQTRADERIPLLLQTPAALHWISAEPLLGPLSLKGYLSTVWEGITSSYVGTDGIERCDMTGNAVPGLKWVVAGGENGPRPPHPEWFRTIRDECAAADVAFFLKQWGSWAHMPGRAYFKDAYKEPWKRVDSQISQVRPALMFKVGKAAAGDVLDGWQHHNWPEAGQ